MHHDPMVVAFTPQMPWKWPKVKATFATVDMGSFYLDVVNRENLWSMVARGGDVEKILTRLVIIPHVMVLWLCNQDRSRNELWCWIKKHSVSYTRVARDDWDTLYEFSITESQEGVLGNRLIYFKANPVMVTDAAFFW